MRKYCDMYKVIIVLFSVILQFSENTAFERKLEYKLNPGCNDECNLTHSVTVVHVTATGPNDTLHYLWDFAGKPTILLALTSHGANLTINWNDFLFGKGDMSVQFTEQPIYSFGIVLNQIVEYNDIQDSGYLDLKNTNSSYVRLLSAENFDWRKTALEQKDRSVVLSVEASGYNDNVTSRKGNIRIMLHSFGFLEHSDTLPRLIHSANSTVVEIEMDNLETEPTFKSSRFAVEFLLASTDEITKAMSIDERKSLDDEESPGVFTLVDLKTPGSEVSSLGGGFLQWRPVAYISRTRSLANSTETNSYNVMNVTDPERMLNNTLLSAFYGYELVNNTLVQKTTVSFGLKQDGFYKKTNYTTWTFTVGYGQPPNEDFSLLVILVIAIGLGLPALLILISGVVFVVRRITRKQDELCLSR